MLWTAAVAVDGIAMALTELADIAQAEAASARGHISVMAVGSGYPRPLRHQLADPEVLSRSPGQRHALENVD